MGHIQKVYFKVPSVQEIVLSQVLSLCKLILTPQSPRDINHSASEQPDLTPKLDLASKRALL